MLCYYKDIKQEIVHTLLLEEYGVSKKWEIITDKRQDKIAASTQAETSGSSAHDRYCARGSGGGAKIGVQTEMNKDKSSSCNISFTCDDVRCFL